GVELLHLIDDDDQRLEPASDPRLLAGDVTPFALRTPLRVAVLHLVDGPLQHLARRPVVVVPGALDHVLGDVPEHRPIPEPFKSAIITFTVGSRIAHSSSERAAAVLPCLDSPASRKCCWKRFSSTGSPLGEIPQGMRSR